MKVVFFGTPPFAASLLKEMLQSGINVVGIVTKADKAQGRSQKFLFSAVKELALVEAPSIPLFQPQIVSALDFAPQLAALKADLFVVVAYGEIIKQHLLDMPRFGCINVHASILPKYRGAAPIQWALLNNETESGVTIMQMVRKMDAGDIIRVAKVPIEEGTTYGELTELLCQASKKPLIEVLNDYQKGIIPAHTPQEISEVTFAPKIELEECQIDWNRLALDLHCTVRGVNPEPGAWTEVWIKGEKKRLKIYRSKVVEHPSLIPGTLIEFGKQGILIACGKNALLILELQLEGKRRMSSKEFCCGLTSAQITFIGPS